MENINQKRNELARIFAKEEDRYGTDLLAMSDFFGIYKRNLEKNVKKNHQWEEVQDIGSLAGSLAAAIKGKIDLSKAEVLIADTSHFNSEIKKGIKKGIYKLGQSKEVDGNLRPVIIDEKGKIKKYVTLRRAYDPSSVLHDVTLISMQSSLKSISTQLKEMHQEIGTLIGLNRNDMFNNKFMNARDRIILASTANDADCEKYLDEADRYLMEGLNALYADMNSHATIIRKQKIDKSFYSSINYFTEDMLLIPRYVALRSYLYEYRGKNEDSVRILKEYKRNLAELQKKNKEEKEKYSVLEIVHNYCRYSIKSMDFWIEKPREMVKTISSIESFLECKEKKIYLIE